MLCVAHLPDPNYARVQLEQLRASLLEDPYFKDVPSMRSDARKPAMHFHAKDDIGEVRREVFRLLPSLGAKVQVIVRRKRSILDWVRYANELDEELRVEGTDETRPYRYQPNDVYDDCVKRLFRNLLHKADSNRIVFARRGKRARAEALRAALERAKQNFRQKHGMPFNRPTRIQSRHPWQDAGLQIIDYYLWALQRVFERGQDRFFNLLRSNYRLIIDLDDTRQKPYGRYYSDADPLTVQKIGAI
jgi:hypothetical protein